MQFFKKEIIHKKSFFLSKNCKKSFKTIENGQILPKNKGVNFLNQHPFTKNI